VLAERALTLHRELGDRGEECNALNLLGITRAVLGDYAASERDLRLSLEIAESIAYSVGIDYAGGNLGRLHYFRRGELEGCLALVEEWMDKAVVRRNEWLVGTLLSRKGVTLALLGQYQAARSALERSLGVSQSAGSEGEEALNRYDLAYVRARLGDSAGAREDLRFAAARARETGDGILLGGALIEDAQIAWLEGHREEMQAGLELVKEALAALPQNATGTMADGYEVGARLHLAVGELAEAEVSSRKAVDLVEASWAWRRPQAVWFTHSQVLRALGREAEADEYLRRAYERVMLVAGKTTDPDLKRSWLEDVRANREILAACAERGMGR
jgi:tetratricopeptide (TPR) repeat protein